MRKVKIITDSCADLNGEQLKRYDIDYVRMSTVEEGKEAPALLTWSAEEAHELYEAIRKGRRITTAQVAMEEFFSVFERYLKEGFDIVYIACSSRQSGSVSTGHVAAQRLLRKYPEAMIYCIDSLNASIGEGMLAMDASSSITVSNTLSRNGPVRYVLVRVAPIIGVESMICLSNSFSACSIADICFCS